MKNYHFILLLLGVAILGSLLMGIKVDHSLIQASVLSPFIDVDSSHKYYKPIQFLKDQNVVIGYTDGTFKPDKPLTRAEFMKIIILGSRLSVPKATSSPFTDVKLGEWYADFIVFGADKGYVQGYPDGKFRPDQEINKVEALKILGELVMWDLNSLNQSGISNPYVDTSLDAWYGKYLLYAIDRNLLDGTGTLYNPGKAITRGQMTEYIFRDYVTRTLDTKRYELVDGEQIFNGDTQTSTITSCASGDDALAKVKQEIVSQLQNKDHLRVFRRSTTLKNGDEFEYFTNGEAEATTQKINEEQWFFWIDPHTDEAFEHDTKIATINTSNCEIKQYESDLWPAINNKNIWSSDLEKDSTPDLVYWVNLDDAPNQLENEPLPVFGNCNADLSQKKKAIILYLGTERFFRLDAVNMFQHLCDKDYDTLVVSGTDKDTILQTLANDLQSISNDSAKPNGSLKNFFLYVHSHARRNGDLLFANDTGVTNFIELPYLSSMVGGYAFSTMHSESFTVAQDSCYSGNAVPLYQLEAEDSKVAVGWIGVSSNATTQSKAAAETGSVFTNSLLSCAESIVPYQDFQNCLHGKMTFFLQGEGPDTSMMEKLSTFTSGAVPFMP